MDIKEPKKRGRKPIGETNMTRQEVCKRYYQKKKESIGNVEPKKRGRKPKGETAMTRQEVCRKYYLNKLKKSGALEAKIAELETMKKMLE